MSIDNNQDLKCPICGEPSYLVFGKNPRRDRLCGFHSQQFFNKLIYQCPDCGKWVKKDENCECKKVEEEKSKEKIYQEYTELPTEGFEKCILCGAKSRGYAFCKDCWGEYTYDELLDMLNNFGNGESLKNKIIDEKIEEKVEAVPAPSINCLICGKPSGLNHFCLDCASKYKDSKINLAISKLDEVEIQEDAEDEERTPQKKCLLCNEDSGEFLFCKECFSKYRNKTLLLKITVAKNQELKLMDESYEGMYVCKDGHVVKSKSEREIDNYLFEHGIHHAYELELPYGASEKEVIHPDFYLPNYLGEGNDVYLEHWGYDESNIEYTKTKNFKMPIYEDLGVTLICTYEKSDMGKIDSVLMRKLNKKFIKVGEINYKEEN